MQCFYPKHTLPDTHVNGSNLHARSIIRSNLEPSVKVLKHTSTCGQKKLGVEPPTLPSVGESFCLLDHKINKNEKCSVIVVHYKYPKGIHCHAILSLCMIFVCLNTFNFQLPLLRVFVFIQFQNKSLILKVISPFSRVTTRYLTYSKTAVMLIISPSCHMLSASAVPVHFLRRLSMVEPPLPPALPPPHSNSHPAFIPVHDVSLWK